MQSTGRKQNGFVVRPLLLLCEEHVEDLLWSVARERAEPCDMPIGAWTCMGADCYQEAKKAFRCNTAYACTPREKRIIA